MSGTARERLLEQTAMGRRRIPPFMIAANYFPFLYLLLGGWVVFAFGTSAFVQVNLVVLWIYVLPPLIGRVILTVFGRPRGVATPNTQTYRVWWFLTQLQMPFNRFGFLEEVLRLVPGLYGLWLNLWGSRVSLLVYWSPGVVVTDRYLVCVSRGAVMGARCLIGGHLITRNHDGDYHLTVAEVTVGEGAIVGVNVAIAPGCEIHPHEVVPAGRYLGPFSGWKDGKRTAVHRHRAAVDAESDNGS